MNEERYIQIGVTALRNPADGSYLPAVPLYIKAEDGAAEAEEKLIDDITNVEEGYKVASLSRDGVITPHIQALGGNIYAVNDRVYFFLFDDGHGMILAAI